MKGINMKGFVVTDSGGEYMSEGTYYPDKTVLLLFGDEITVYRTYEKARNAVRRSKRYAKKHKLSWADDYEIKECFLVLQ